MSKTAPKSVKAAPAAAPKSAAVSVSNATAVHRALADAVRGRKTFGEVLGVSRDEMLGLARTGSSLVEHGQLDDALVVFEGLLTLNPRIAYLHMALGAVHQRAGRAADGIAAYTKALSLDPGLAGAHANLGELLLESGDREKGLAELRRALEIDPAASEPATLRARALLDVIAREPGPPKEPQGSADSALPRTQGEGR